LTLVDCGPDTREAYAAVRDGLTGAGFGIADLERIVITHAHVDHSGLAPRLQAQSGARVLAHGQAIHALEDWPATWRSRLDLVDVAAKASAVPAELREAYADGALPMAALGASLRADVCTPLVDGQSPRLGGRRWRILHTPGHSRDHLCLFDPRTGDLLSGDLLFRHLPTPLLLEPRRSDGGRPDTLAALIASWRRIGRLDVTRVWPGHGTPLRAHRVQLARRLAEARDGVRQTREALRGGASTVWEVAEATGLPLKANRLALVLGLVVARLDWLAERGLAERRLEGAQLRFAPRTPRRGARSRR
jgi:glyoxylase-like metal-dependent hydrolase (beta-lactamase superfamily II)